MLIDLGSDKSFLNKKNITRPLKQATCIHSSQSRDFTIWFRTQCFSVCLYEDSNVGIHCASIVVSTKGPKDILRNCTSSNYIHWYGYFGYVSVNLIKMATKPVRHNVCHHLYLLLSKHCEPPWAFNVNCEMMMSSHQQKIQVVVSWISLTTLKYFLPVNWDK